MHNYFSHMLIVSVHNGIFVKMKLNEKYSYTADGVLTRIASLTPLTMEFMLTVY